VKYASEKPHKNHVLTTAEEYIMRYTFVNTW